MVWNMPMGGRLARGTVTFWVIEGDVSKNTASFVAATVFPGQPPGEGNTPAEAASLLLMHWLSVLFECVLKRDAEPSDPSAGTH